MGCVLSQGGGDCLVRPQIPSCLSSTTAPDITSFGAIHTNAVEGFWSIVKRRHSGVPGRNARESDCVRVATFVGSVMTRKSYATAERRIADVKSPSHQSGARGARGGQSGGQFDA